MFAHIKAGHAKHDRSYHIIHKYINRITCSSITPQAISPAPSTKDGEAKSTLIMASGGRARIGRLRAHARRPGEPRQRGRTNLCGMARPCTAAERVRRKEPVSHTGGTVGRSPVHKTARCIPWRTAAPYCAQQGKAAILCSEGIQQRR